MNFIDGVKCKRAEKRSHDEIRQFIECYLEMTLSFESNRDFEYYVAHDNEGELIAVVGVTPCSALDCNWLLKYVVVHPLYRGMGVMTKLLALVCRVLAGGIMVEAYACGVVAETNGALCKNGFECVDVLIDYWRKYTNCRGCKVVCAADIICDNHLYVRRGG